MIRNTHAIIRYSALEHNILLAKSKLKENTRLLAVIKANAYGHGIVPVGQHLDDFDAVAMFGVAIVEEGAQLRANGIRKPILILGATDAEHMQTVVDNDLTAAVFLTEHLETLERIAAQRNKIVSVHLKLDTGMRRIGICDDPSLHTFLQVLADCPHVRLDGVFTHFAKSESDADFTAKQAERFDAFVRIIQSYGHSPILHTANSGGILMHPQYQYDMVRLGISLYGCHPDGKQTKDSGLMPVMQVVSAISNLKTVHAGEGVSYGLRYIADGERRIATVPIGYGDGYKRCLTNKSDVLIGGQRCPQVGTICMDQLMVDVSDVADAAIGDEVVLLGMQGNACITADELADLANTISYEILLSFSERVPRIYK